MTELAIREKYDFGKNCVCVGRVSTSSQSQTAQLEDLQKFAQAYGFKKIQPFFTTESGFLEFDNKQGWNLVADFFNSHKDYRVLICPELSRLSRKEAILFKIKDFLIENKIQLIIKDINFQLFDEWGEIPKGNDIVFALYASLADSEMRQKKERFRRALEDYRRLGYSIGGKELFGYDRFYEKKDGKERSKYKINDSEAEQIRTIFRWYAFGIDGDLTKTSIFEITKKCIEEGFSHYLHSKRNVNKCLKERAYLGEKETHNRVHNSEYWNYRDTDKPKYIEGKSFICTYPAIFTGENIALFERVQQRLIENNTKISSVSPVDKSTQHTTILSKLIVCPSCGTFMHGEYRAREDKRRPNLGVRYYNVYRCIYSRGAIHACQFKHSLSMPMLDSIVWAYCKAATLGIINSERRKNTEELIAEINKKITNLRASIKEYNIEAKIESEETILRGRTSRLKSPEALDAAIKTFETNVAGFEKELSGLEARVLELEQKIEDIKNSSDLVDSLVKRNSLPTNKKEIYHYIHRIVEKIDIVSSDKNYTILKIHIKENIPFYRNDEYLCIKKRTTRQISTLILRPYKWTLKESMKIEHNNADKQKMYFSRFIAPIKHTLLWNKETNQFEIDGIGFGVEKLFDYYYNSNQNEQSLDNMSTLHIRAAKLNVERLSCYDEDNKPKIK